MGVSLFKLSKPPGVWGSVSNSWQLLIVLSFWQIASFLSLTPSLPATSLLFPLPSFSFSFFLSLPPVPFCLSYSQVQLSLQGSRSLLFSSFRLSCCIFLLYIIPFFLLLFWWSSIIYWLHFLKYLPTTVPSMTPILIYTLYFLTAGEKYLSILS